MKKSNIQNLIFVFLLFAVVYLGKIASDQTEMPTTAQPKSFLAQTKEIDSASAISLKADLTKMILYYLENNEIKKEFKIIAKGESTVWWQTPTGKFKIGIKSRNYWSDLYLANLPWALQIYEDFFIHGAPKDKNGKILPDAFTGGDLRLSDEDAKTLYDSISQSAPIFVYENDLEEISKKIIEGNEFIPQNLKAAFENNKFILPINPGGTYIKKDFASPTIIGGERGKYSKYVNHAGVDFAPISSANKNALAVKAVASGRVALFQKNDGNDYGFGNVLILEHRINENTKFIYSLYSHLKSFSREFKEGETIRRDETIGTMGASGFGCENYWRRGENGCECKDSPDIFLHFELKETPILYNPLGEHACIYQDGTDEFPDYCYEYTPNEPLQFGYLNPIKFILENL